MGSSKDLLCALLGMSLVSLALSAAVEYQEPVMEANTMPGKGESGLEEEMPENEDGSVDITKSSGEMDENVMEEVDTLKKINDVEEEESGESSSSEEGESSSSSEEEPGMVTKCSNGIEAVPALLSVVNSTNTKDCQLSIVLQSMTELLKVLSSDVAELKGQMNKNCSGGDSGGSEEEDSDESEEEEEVSGEETMGSGGEDKEEEEDDKKKKGDDDEDNEEEEEEETTTEAVMETTPAPPTIPPPPAVCPPPFQLLAESCYYIQTDRREKRSWGDAHSFCQQQGGTLAAPYRAEELRNYLSQSYSNSFWMGARKVSGVWQWLTGLPLQDDDWREGKPNKNPSQRCVYIDSFYGYKGVNYFCGEKFSFICEHRGM